MREESKRIPSVQVGDRYNRWTVLAKAGRSKSGKIMYECRCDCGTLKAIIGANLKRGGSKSCGCYGSEVWAANGRKSGAKVAAALRQHGHSPASGMSPTYRSWAAMVRRCTNPNTADWPYYGGRGITVHPDWVGRGGFARFLAHIGERPEGHSIDRIDNSRGYGPGNVCWATRKAQANNRRRRTTPRT